MRTKIVCLVSVIIALLSFCGILLIIEEGRTATETFIGVIICAVVCGISLFVASIAIDESLPPKRF